MRFTLGLGLVFSMAAHANFGNYTDVQLGLQNLSYGYPANAALVEIGTSDSGKIYGLKIGHGAVNDLVVGTHHGNEYGSTEVAMAVAESLAADPLPNRTVFVVPVLNISGFNSRTRWENGHDANRDYPSPCGSDGPFTLRSTKALADFIEREHIVASATLHTFHGSVTYPWGLTTSDLETPYTNLFRQIAGDATQESGYQIGNSSDVIYPANGTFEDYAFEKHGIWSMLFELGYTHSPDDGEVETLRRVNVPGIRRMLANAPTERATDHEFHGYCDRGLRALDLHNE